MFKKSPILCFVLLSACLWGPYSLPKTTLDKAFLDTKTQVLQQKRHYRLLFPVTANFKSNSAVLSPQLMILLDRTAKVLRAHANTSVVVHGYTDDQGETQANQALSERRAHATISYLESQGVSPNRLITHSHGASCFRSDEDADNRRIEISIHYGPGSYEDDCLAATTLK